MPQNKIEKHAAEVVVGMKHARDIATKLFGTTSNGYAVQEIFDYLAQADEDDFVSDLTNTLEHTKEIYGTATPTPEQVFGVFERIFLSEEE